MTIERVTIETATRSNWRRPTEEEKDMLPAGLRARVSEYMNAFKRLSKIAKKLRVELLDEWPELNISIINGTVLVDEGVAKTTLTDDDDTLEF
jgi:hypothetical protein